MPLCLSCVALYYNNTFYIIFKKYVCLKYNIIDILITNLNSTIIYFLYPDHPVNPVKKSLLYETGSII